jgi:hypothetical protein
MESVTAEQEDEMDRRSAETLVEHLRSLDHLIGSIDEVLTACAQSPVVEGARSETFRAGYELHAAVARLVVAEFPDLDPDKLNSGQ